MDRWNFEIVQLRGRKVDKYGDNYTCVATLTITDGELHVEGLLSNNDFCSSDKRTIEDFIKNLGFDYYISSYYKNGKRKIVKNELELATI